MKFFKLTLAVFTMILMSCGSDDEGTTARTPVEIIPDISIDVDAILALPANSDITDLVSFGQPAGISTSEYTAELFLNDILTLGVPSGLQAGDVFIYSDIFFVDPEAEVLSETYLECVLDGEVNNFCLDEQPQEFGIRVVDADATADLTWKYDIECYIRRGATEFGPFTIDPKIRIKSRSSL